MSRKQLRPVVHSEEEIPDFATEEEEATWWDTHELGDEFYEKPGSVPEDLLPPVRETTVSRPTRAR